MTMKYQSDYISSLNLQIEEKDVKIKEQQDEIMNASREKMECDKRNVKLESAL